MNPIDTLMKEHETIRAGLALLLEAAQRLRAGGRVENLPALLDFFSRFADARHHAKEENLLFPAMAAAGMPMGGGPIAVMLMDHDQGRELVRRMRASLDQPKAFADAAEQFAAHLDHHIDKENNVLFRMAQQLIPGEAMRQLEQDFDLADSGTSPREVVLDEVRRAVA